MPYRLGILSTHPIQYQVPWLRRLSESPELDVTVFYCQIPDAVQQGDGFGIEFQWDIPLLDGYRYKVLPNVATRSSVTTFLGCDTPSIATEIRNGRFDAFLVPGWVVKSSLQALSACRRYQVPCIVRGESNTLRLRPWWKRLIHRRLLSRYSAFLAIGRSNRDFYLSNGVPPNRIFPAYYCVDNERFAAEAAAFRPKRSLLRKHWGIDCGRIVLLFCGKFLPKKRPLDLLTAANVALERGAPIHLLLVGDGSLRHVCEQYARDGGLPATFTGFLNQSELPAAYVASDCLVLPSDSGETWGLVVNEAMACGLPALVSDQVGCGPDLIIPDRTGAVFPLGDTSALAAYIVHIAADPDRLRALGRAAQRHVGAYCIDAAVSGTLEATAALRLNRSAPATTLLPP